MAKDNAKYLGYTRVQKLPPPNKRKPYTIYEVSPTPPTGQTWFSSVVAAATLFLYTTWAPLLAIVMAVWSYHSSLGLLFLAVTSTTVFMPANGPWPWYRSGYIFQSWREYFNFRVVYEEDLGSNKHYVMAHFPHGVVPISPILLGSVPVTHQTPSFGVGASFLFRIPGYKHMHVWFGIYPATRKKVLSLLERGNVGIVVGGIAEQFMTHPDELVEHDGIVEIVEHREHIKVQSRRGFIKVAVQTGSDIVPVYHFGSNQVMDAFGGPLLRWLSRKVGISIMLPYGRFYLPVPYRQPLLCALGKPLKVEKMSPSNSGYIEQVERLHKEFTNELARLFEKYKQPFGWETKTLALD